MDREPLVSICTVTYMRPGLLELLEERVHSQTYPHNKIQWVILDDSPEPHQRYQALNGQHSQTAIKYIHLPEKLPLGKKRNESHLHCDGEIIVYMDDDDFYPPSRVEHAVEALMNSEKEIAGTSKLPNFSVGSTDFWISGPHGENHATPGTFAFKRSFLDHHSYSNEDICEEGKKFLNNYTSPMIQLDPFQTILCISHQSNTYNQYTFRQQSDQSIADTNSNLSEDQIRVLTLIKEEFLAADSSRFSMPHRFAF